jgi:predicted O-methyltransferase YrrM
MNHSGFLPNLPNHGKYMWLPILYNIVEMLKPKKIVEIGPGKGFTTITMALAVKENQMNCNINSYDIWNDSYWGNFESTMNFYKEWKVNNYINLYEKDFYDWLKINEEFDFLYLDIDNDGDKLLTLYNKVYPQIEKGSVVFFEGGAPVREVFEGVRSKISYKLLTGNIKYSASLIYNDQIYELEF